MKIPASSSIILATLAISSSSSALAAPTGTAETSSDVDPSQNSAQPSSTIVPGVDEDGGEGANKRNLEERGPGMVSDILAGLPVVGPLAKALLVKECPPPDSASAQSLSVSGEDLARLQSAVDTVSGALSGVLPTGVPISLVPTGAIASMVPAPLQSVIAGMAVDGSSSTEPPPSDATPTTTISAPTNDAEAAGANDGDSDSSFLISPSTTVARAEAANETAPSSPPPSPGVPSGPPNTPAMPEATPDPDYQNPDQEAK